MLDTWSAPSVTVLNEALSPAEREAVLDAWRHHLVYRPSFAERLVPSGTSGAPGAPSAPSVGEPSDASAGAPGRVGWRYDVARSHHRAPEAVAVVGVRNNYFRATYAQAGRPGRAGTAPLMCAKSLVEAAVALYGCPVVVPQMVYANVLLPGQELASHADVPEFLGAGRHDLPGWLLVAMHHSGLFADQRVPVATAVIYPAEGALTDFYYSPPGAEPPVQVTAEVNGAVVLDADTVLHGVSRVPGPLAPVTPTSRLHRLQGGWRLERPAADPIDFGDAEVRYSVSWKALCFTDDGQRRRFRSGEHRLTRRAVVQRMFAELRRRHRISGRVEGWTERQVADLLLDEFVGVP